MERKTAEQIVALANGCIDQLLESLVPAEQVLSPEEFATYKRGVAKVMNTIDREIIEVAAREFPDLKTDDDSDHDAQPEAPRSANN
jgi:hypothetical protein